MRCAICNSAFTQSGLGRPRKYCEMCSPKQPFVYVSKPKVERQCSECGTRFASAYKQSTCGEECRAKRATRLVREYWYEKRGAHVDRQHAKCLNPKCGQLFQKGLRRKFCSNKCKTQYRDTNRPGKSVTTRIRKFGTARVEDFKRIEIFQRDKWMCQLCGKRAPKRLMGTDSLFAPTIDHKVALSKGGDHTRQNVQCAHLICNIRKGDR